MTAPDPVRSIPARASEADREDAVVAPHRSTLRPVPLPPVTPGAEADRADHVDIVGDPFAPLHDEVRPGASLPVPSSQRRPATSSTPSAPPSSYPPAGELDAPPPILPDAPKGSLLWRIGGMVRTVRPHQWMKNLFVLAPIVFAKELTSPKVLVPAAGAFFVFCLLAGAVYTLNDLVDVEADRVHPVKRHRPIASGRVPLPLARAMAVGLVFASLLGAALFLPLTFAVVAAVYFAQNVAYSFKLKKLPYVDVGCIALGFVLRVLAGGFATDTRVSVYMITCTALLALFLGFGKRRHEIAGANAGKQRAALEAYNPKTLNLALGVTGLGSVANYLAYTLDADTQRFFATTWLWPTTAFTLFGVVRFLQLVAGRPRAESPTQEMLRDVPFMLNLVAWVLAVIGLVYHVRFAT